MNLLKREDVEKLLSDLSLTPCIFNEPCVIISKLLRLLWPKFETTQRNLCFEKYILKGCLPLPQMPDYTHANSVLKLPSNFGCFGPGCVFYM